MGTKRGVKNDDDEDDDRPAKRRKARDEEEDDRPSGRGGSKKESRSDVDNLDEVDDLEELDEDENYERALKDLNRKKAQRLKQYTALTEGLEYFEKHIRLLLVGTGVTVATVVAIYLFTQVADYFAYLYFVPVLMLIGLGVLLPLLMILGAKNCQSGPPKCARSGSLVGIIVVSLLSGAGSFPNFVFLSIYLRHVARTLKDKQQAKVAHGVLLQLIFIGLGGIVVLAIAFYFLRLMGMLGYILFGAFALVYVLLNIKILVETMGILRNLCNTIGRAMKAEETVEW